MDQFYLIDICRALHWKTMEFIFFSSVCGTFSRINHILGHKSSLDTFKKEIEIISSIFSDHNTIRLFVNYKEKKNLKIQTYGAWTTHFWVNKQIRKEIKREIKICLETKGNENKTTKHLWDSVKAALLLLSHFSRIQLCATP